MSSKTSLRSPLLMSRGDAALLVVDIQEKLMPAIRDNADVLARCMLLIDGAKLLGVPILVTEQYPRGLGKTLPVLAEKLETPLEKVVFSCCGAPTLLEKLGKLGVEKVLLCGIETHVCVQQTAFDLLAHGFRPLIAADAVGSRTAIDKEWALRRMADAGITVTTAEAAVFEWAESAAAPEFKEISQLIKAQTLKT